MADPRVMLPQPDLVGAYLAGQQARQNQLRLSEMYAARDERDRNRRELAYYRQTGDLEGLQRGAPEVAERIAKQQAEQRAARIDEAGKLSVIADRENRFAAEQAKLRADRTAEEQRRAAMALQQNPAVAPFIKKRIDLLAQRGEIDAFDLPGQTVTIHGEQPIDVPPTQQDVATFGAMAGVEQPADPYSAPTNDMREFTAATGKRPGDPGYREEFEAWDLRRRKASKTEVNVSNGSAAASQKTIGTQEAELLDAQDQLALLEDIAKLATPAGASAPDFSQFLGWAPKGKKFALDVIDSISPESVPPNARDWYDKMSQFRSYVDEYKAGRYNKLLGSAQSQSEVRNLMNAVLSAEMGTTQFNAAYSRMMNVLPRKIRIAEQVVAEGIPLGGREYRNRFAEIERGDRVSRKIDKTAPALKQKLDQVDALLKAGTITPAEAEAARAKAYELSGGR